MNSIVVLKCFDISIIILSVKFPLTALLRVSKKTCGGKYDTRDKNLYTVLCC